MDADLVKCGCCGKLVSRSNIELAFRRPDDIAAMTADAIDERCNFNDDLYVLDHSRFFVRCKLPLPVLGGDAYSIGAWVEVGESDFSDIWHLWSAERQSELPPIQAVLSNQVPLTEHSLGCRVTIQLTGPKTRPHIAIVDSACSLFDEQKDGITVHRAAEYSNLVER